MKILLCVPDQMYTQGEWVVLPIGIAYVSSSLKKAGHTVHTVNFCTERRPVKDVLSEIIINNDIDLVGCGDLVVQYDRVKEIIDAAKQIKPEVTTVIGGGLVTFSPNEAMTIIDTADYGIVGEGDYSACELVSALENKSGVSNISGIVYRTGDGKIASKEAVDIPDINTLPFPDYEGFFADIISDTKMASIVCSRSCPFNCSFCSHSGGRTYRQREIDGIIDEIDFLVSTYSMKYLTLSDELFAVKTDRILEFCERISPYHLKWHLSLRLNDNLTKDIITAMKRAGCVRLDFGLESADDTILTCMDKKTSVALMEKVLENAYAANMEVAGSFIFGVEEETWQTAMNTLNWARIHRPLIPFPSYDMIRLFPGSPMYNRAVRNGTIADTVKHIENGCSIKNVSKMSEKEYAQLWEEVFPKEEGLQFSESSWPADISFTTKRENDQVFYSAQVKCRKCGSKMAFSAPTVSNRVVWGYGSNLTEYYSKSCDHLENYFWKHIRAEHSKWVAKNLENYLKQHPRCALWGVGKILRRLMGVSPTLESLTNPYQLIDKNPTLQNTIMYNRRVCSPGVLREGTIDTVITTTVQYHAVIRDEIVSKYPQIRVLNLFEDIGAAP